MKVSAGIQPGFILNPLGTYESSYPPLIPDNLFLNNATGYVNFDRNITGLVYADKNRGTEKRISHGNALLPHLAKYLHIKGDMDE